MTDIKPVSLKCSTNYESSPLSFWSYRTKVDLQIVPHRRRASVISRLNAVSVTKSIT